MTASTDLPPSLSFTLSEDEYWTLRKLEAYRVDRGPSWNEFWAVIIAYAFGVGFAALAARSIGLVGADEFAAVLATAYIASALGIILFYWLLRWRSRQLTRRQIRAAGGSVLTVQIDFDAEGITCITGPLTRRGGWRAMTAIEARGPALMIWLGRAYVLTIPVRVFADDAARAAFVAAVEARIAQSRP